MAHDSPPLDPLDDKATLEAELVAYLDQELDEESARRIEQLLAADPAVRDTLRQLERTWEALEELHRAEVDEKFTQSTLEMVVVAASQELEAQRQDASRRRWRQRLVGVGALLAAGVAGFGATTWLWPDPNEALLRDLPVIENLDHYRHIDDIEFLRLLHEEGLFVEERGDGA